MNRRRRRWEFGHGGGGCDSLSEKRSRRGRNIVEDKHTYAAALFVSPGLHAGLFTIFVVL
jgi:hypothetical protein